MYQRYNDPLVQYFAEAVEIVPVALSYIADAVETMTIVMS